MKTILSPLVALIVTISHLSAQNLRPSIKDSEVKTEQSYSFTQKAGINFTASKTSKYPAQFESQKDFSELYNKGEALDIYNQKAEDFDKRDAYSKHYSLGNGTFVTCITAGPQHYLKDGIWHTILNKITPVSIPGYTYGNVYNSHHTYYGTQANSLLKITENGNEVLTFGSPVIEYINAQNEVLGRIELLNFSEAKTSKYSITYQNAANGIDFIINQNPFGFKYSIILKDQSILNNLPIGTTALRFNEHINASGFAKTEGANEGYVKLSNSSHNIKIHTFSVYDSKENTSLSNAKNVLFEHNQLSYVVDLDWLKNSDIQFPVYIDPTVTYTPNSFVKWTGTADDDSGGCDYSTDNDSDENIRIGFDDGNFDNDIYDGWAKFSLSALPTNACITNAYSRFYQYNFRNPQSGSHCWGTDDQLTYNYGRFANPALEPIITSCDGLQTAINSSISINSFNVFGTYPLGTANGWKSYLANLSPYLNPLVGVQNHFSLTLNTTSSHSDPGFQGCCFCTPDNDDWIDFSGWNSNERPQLIVTYQTPYNIGSSAAVSVNNVCQGTPVTLTLNGGTNGSDGSWNWYSGSCGGTLVGTSTSTTASLNITAPATSTTYFVRGEGTCGNTVCESITLNILAQSAAAISISSAVDSICNGSSVGLAVVGGTLGAGANWQWYAGSCGGTPAGTGTAISVSPNITTTYYLRAIGTCNTTACISKTIYVSNPSVPGFLNASNLTPCENAPFSISISGHTGAIVHWERELNGGGFISIGQSGSATVNETGLSAGSYTYRAFIKSGACAGVYSNTITVNVIPSTVGGATYAFNPSLCQGTGTLISLSGHIGSILYWERQTNGGGFVNVGSPSSANYSTGILTPGTYEYRAVIQSGNCSTLTSASSIVVVSPFTVAGNTNIVPDTICVGTPLTINLNGQTGSVLQWERDISGSGYINIGGNNTAPLTINPNTPGLHTYRAIVQSGSCSSAISISDMVYVKPIANASITYNSATYCNNASANPIPIIQTPSGIFSASPAGLAFVNTSTGEIDLANSAAGNYTITYQLPAQYCNGSATALVTINAGTIASAVYSNNIYCSNQSNPTPILSPIGGSFSVSPAGLQIAANGTISLAVSTPGTYSVLYTSPGICPTVSSNTITLNASPTPIITGPNIFCNNGAITQINTSIGGGTYSGGPFINATGQFNPSIAGTGMHSIYYQVNSAQGCVGFDTSIIQVNSAPVITINTPAILCDNNNAFALTATPIGGTWSGPFTNSSGVFDPSLSGAGMFTANYSYTDANNCNSTSSIIISVNSSPNSGIQNPGPICTASPIITLIANTAGGTWSGGAYISPTGNFNPATSGAGIFPVTYTVTTNGCTSSSTQNISVSTTPNSTINAVGTLCNNGTPLQLTAATAGGAWSGGPYINNSGVFNPSIAGNGTHTVQYVVTSGACSSTSNLSISVNAAPTPAFTNPTNSICTSDPNTFIAATPSNGSYTGNPYITISGIFDPSLSGNGIFPVTYTVNANGCTASANGTIVVNASPNANFTIPNSNTMCSSDGPSVFNAITPGGTWSGSPAISPSGLFTPSIAGPGVHSITYTVSNAGCTDTHTEIISISAAPNVNILSPTITCLQSGTQLLFANTPGGVWTGNSSYISGAGLFDPLIAGIGSHLVVYTVYGGNGCAGFDSTYIIVNANPDATITYPGTICENAGIQTLTSITPGGSWSGGPYINNNLFDPSVAGTGNHFVQYNVTSAQGCSSQASIVITVNPIPVALFTNQNNGLTSYLSDLSQHSNSWEWDFGDGSSVDTTQNPTHQFPDNGTYFVRLIVSNACGSDTIIKQVYVNKALSNEDYTTNNNNIHLYPNPAKDQLTLTIEKLTHGDAMIDIIDISGKAIFHSKQLIQNNTEEIKIPIANLATGVYTIRILHNGQTYHARFVKQQ